VLNGEDWCRSPLISVIVTAAFRSNLEMYDLVCPFYIANIHDLVVLTLLHNPRTCIYNVHSRSKSNMYIFICHKVLALVDYINN